MYHMALCVINMDHPCPWIINCPLHKRVFIPRHSELRYDDCYKVSPLVLINSTTIESLDKTTQFSKFSMRDIRTGWQKPFDVAAAVLRDDRQACRGWRCMDSQ
jgi:hypothetical protein